MRTPRIFAILCLAFASTLVAQTSNPVVSYAYVGSSTATTQKIYAYAIHSNGAATPVTGSPFSGPANYLANSDSYVFGTDGTIIETYARWSDGTLHKKSSV